MGTYRSLLTIIDRTVIHRRSRWTVLIFCCAIVLYRSIVYEYLAVCTVFGSYISYSLVEYFTPLGLPDPDEDTP